VDVPADTGGPVFAKFCSLARTVCCMLLFLDSSQKGSEREKKEEKRIQLVSLRFPLQCGLVIPKQLVPEDI